MEFSVEELQADKPNAKQRIERMDSKKNKIRFFIKKGSSILFLLSVTQFYGKVNAYPSINYAYAREGFWWKIDGKIKKTHVCG